MEDRQKQIDSMVAHLKSQLESGDPIDLKELADLMDMRRA
jgi:nucleoid-associated protein YejK